MEPNSLRLIPQSAVDDIANRRPKLAAEARYLKEVFVRASREKTA